MSITESDATYKSPPDRKLLLRVNEVAERLQLGRATVYQMIAAGELPTFRKGRAVRVPTRALEAWIDRRISGGLVEVKS